MSLISNFQKLGLTLGLVALSLAQAQVAANSFCDLVVEACPKEFAGKTITVPKNTVALSARMPFCKETVDLPVAEAKPADIVFIIDNSGSMSDSNNGGNDANEARFKQTVIMLDSLYKSSPKSKVAITSFSRRLQFDDRDPHLLAPAFPGTADHDAYVPLTQLDAPVGGGLGIDTLKAMLKHNDRTGSLTYGSTFPATRANANPGIRGVTDLRNGTDITLGFQSALQALKTSTASKENQFFIFISDGEPGSVDDSRAGVINDFKAGVGVPTTFTIFFGRQTSAGYTATNEMTNNIKANGYSKTNPQSAIWSITDASKLQGILESLSGIVNVPAPTSALNATITKGTQVLTSTGVQDSNFLFQKRLALDADLTTFTFDVVYSYTEAGVTKTQPFSYKLTVQRTGANNPAGTSTACHDAPQISLLSENKPITTVTADDENVQVKVTQAAGQTCVGCSTALTSKLGTDKLSVPLTSVANIATGTFTHEVNTTANAADAKLQHYALNDSIVVVLSNPEIPLEVVRKAFPYSDIKTILNVAYHNNIALASDNDARLPVGMDFVLAGAKNLTAQSKSGFTNCCTALDSSTFVDKGIDSTRFVGINFTATREFTAAVRIFDNLGMLVNQTAFTIPKAEFVKLPYDKVTKTRSVRFLWSGNVKGGGQAGTGAYIVLGTVNLLTEAGVAEDKVSNLIRRRVGIVRSKT
jgi:hypothetical protein